MKYLLALLALLIAVPASQAATLNVTNYGCYGDARLLTLNCTTNSYTVNGTNTFVAGDVGKILSITSAGNQSSTGNTNWFDLVAQIVSINNGTNAVLNRPVQHTTNTLAWFGTCDTTNLQTVINTAVAGDIIYFPIGNYLVINPVFDTNWINIYRQNETALTISKSGITLAGESRTESRLIGNGAFQLTAGDFVFRGSMFGLNTITNGTQAATLLFTNLTFDNGIVTGYQPECVGCFPANNITGNYWDLTHKLFFILAGGRPYATNTVWHSCNFQHSRGEMLFSGFDDNPLIGHDYYRATNCLAFDGEASWWNIWESHIVSGCSGSNLVLVAEELTHLGGNPFLWENNFFSNCLTGLTIQGAKINAQPQAPMLIQSNNFSIVHDAFQFGPSMNVTLSGNEIHGLSSDAIAFDVNVSGGQGDTIISNIVIINNRATNIEQFVQNTGSYYGYVTNNIMDGSPDHTVNSHFAFDNAVTNASWFFWYLFNNRAVNIKEGVNAFSSAHYPLDDASNDFPPHQDSRGGDFSSPMYYGYGYRHKITSSTGTSSWYPYPLGAEPSRIPDGARMQATNATGSSVNVATAVASWGPFGLANGSAFEFFWYADVPDWETNVVWSGWISQEGTPDGRTNSIAWFNTAPITFTNVYFTGDFTTECELNESGTPSDNIILDMTRARWIKDVWPTGAFRSPGHGDFQVIGGLFAATNNGSGRGNTNTCLGMDLINTFRAVFNGCTVTGMFVRLPGAEFSPTTLGADTVAMKFTLFQNDITISNCYLSDAEVLLNFKDWGIAQINSGFHIRSNILFRSCISVSFATTFTPTDPRHFRDFYLENNVLDHQSVWGAPPENSSYGLHINYLFPFTANTGGDYDAYGTTISNIVVAGNYFGPDVLSGTNLNTSLAIQSQWGTTNMIVDGFRVYNNVFVWTNTFCHSIWNNGFITITGDTNLFIVNNDFIVTPAVDCDAALLAGRNTVNTMEGYPIFFANNFTRSVHLQHYFNGAGVQTNFVAGTWSDYNVFSLPWTSYTFGNLGQYDFFGPFPGFPANGVGFGWEDWTNRLFSIGTAFGRFDRHSDTNNAAVNADYSPQTNSILLNAGTNLTAYGFFTDDYLGHGRPASGNWTIGAFELPVGGGVTNPIACFSGTPLSGFSPLFVTFTDCSTDAFTWSWDFGDAGTSTLQNPTHTYMASGVYTVSQTVTGYGFTNTLTRNNYITVSQHAAETNVFQGQFQF